VVRLTPVLLVLLLACGSTTIVESGGDGGSAAAGQGAGSQGAGGVSGNGGAIGAGPPQGCPAAPPDEGSTCEPVGESCDWGTPECATTANCTVSGWSLDVAGDCACPSDVPTGPCEQTGKLCDYTLGAGCDSSITVACSDDGLWTVTNNTAACGFVCPDDLSQLPATCDPCCHHPCSGSDGGCFYWWASCAGGEWQVVATPC
jgi:hypothetical protein